MPTSEKGYSDMKVPLAHYQTKEFANASAVGESYRYRTGYGNRTTCFPRKRVMVGAQLLHSAQAQSKGSNSLKEKRRLNKKQRQGEKKSILTLVDVNFHDVV